MAIHDLLAEYGLCCVGEGGKGEEGTFLRFAIKHLLALDMKLKSNLNSSSRESTQHDKQLSPHSQNKISKKELKSDTRDVVMGGTEIDETSAVGNDAVGGITSASIHSLFGPEKDNAGGGCEMQVSDEDKNKGGKTTERTTESINELTEDEGEELELIIDGALDQCFFCLYGLNIRSDSSYEDDLAMHKNTSRGDYQTKEQCADVFQYILPYAKASSVSAFCLSHPCVCVCVSVNEFLLPFDLATHCKFQRTGLVKLRRVLRAIRKHFPQPPEDVLIGNAIDRFLDDLNLCEDKLSEEAGSEGYLETITKMVFPDVETVKQHRSMMVGRYFICYIIYFISFDW